MCFLQTGLFRHFSLQKNRNLDRNLTVFFFFFYKTPSNGCLYIYNSISEAHIIGRQLLCIQKNKIVDKVHKKKIAIFFFFKKKLRIYFNCTIALSTRIITHHLTVTSVSSRTLPVSYRPPSSTYSSSSSFSSSSSLS